MKNPERWTLCRSEEGNPRPYSLTCMNLVVIQSDYPFLNKIKTKTKNKNKKVIELHRKEMGGRGINI